jgi:hypothetical protein
MLAAKGERKLGGLLYAGPRFRRFNGAAVVLAALRAIKSALGSGAPFFIDRRWLTAVSVW